MKDETNKKVLKIVCRLRIFKFNEVCSMPYHQKSLSKKKKTARISLLSVSIL